MPNGYAVAASAAQAGRLAMPLAVGLFAPVADALIAGAASGKVSDAGRGAPNRLLRVPES